MPLRDTTQEVPCPCYKNVLKRPLTAAEYRTRADLLNASTLVHDGHEILDAIYDMMRLVELFLDRNDAGALPRAFDAAGLGSAMTYKEHRYAATVRGAVEHLKTSLWLTEEVMGELLVKTVELTPAGEAYGQVQNEGAPDYVQSAQAR